MVSPGTQVGAGHPRARPTGESASAKAKKRRFDTHLFRAALRESPGAAVFWPRAGLRPAPGPQATWPARGVTQKAKKSRFDTHAVHQPLDAAAGLAAGVAARAQPGQRPASFPIVGCKARAPFAATGDGPGGPRIGRSPSDLCPSGPSRGGRFFRTSCSQRGSSTKRISIFILRKKWKRRCGQAEAELKRGRR